MPILDYISPRQLALGSLTMDYVEAIVVGAGVVGLAVARALAADGKEVLILEAGPQFGGGTSSRNSEVVHAGLYYPNGSMKAELCVEGRDLLYRFCQNYSVPHQRLGKLIFAGHPGHVPSLDSIEKTAIAAGVTDLVRLDRHETRQLEPALPAAEAIFSPSTGIVDSHTLMLTLLGVAEDDGAILVCNTLVSRVQRQCDNWRIWTAGASQPVVETSILVNAAGLGAQSLAHMIDGLESDHIPALHLARGTYFAYSGRVPFSHLIYPVPEPGGLGTHLTLDMSGHARFGPDVEWIDRVNYDLDIDRRPSFASAARRIWPDIDCDRLYPGYSGIRPKLSGPNEPAADFVLSGQAQHGLAGLINLFGIESPGLTASLAIGNRVAALLAVG